ncbi:TIGR02270 family protein [Archangium violaceum]|uniref:TIGR02270 family protein n=1 Tax=Archangium violaceum TaxID=83451 RepID=UPI00193C27C4|nr:TIGR02270 family protein [Archangium violaceum]QRK10884.1 TIGR02270 family protein [Archangium violaceum]
MASVMMDVYEEHLDEATFLWSRWEHSLVAPEFNLEGSAELEKRLLAHLDGLVLGGELVAEALLKPALESGEAPRQSAALWSLLAEPGLLEPAEVTELLRAAPQDSLAALGRALELNEREEVGTALRPLLKDGSASHQALALEVLAFQGKLPPATCVELLSHPDEQVVVAALRGLRPLTQELLSRELPRLLADGRPRVREAAIATGAISGSRAAWEACRKAVEGRGEVGRDTLLLLALAGKEQDIELLVARALSNGADGSALFALGFSGQVKAMETCLELMEKKPMAALAGEAFSAMTGLELAASYVMQEQEEESLPPLEEDLERDLGPKPEDALPVPDREAVTAWWSQARKNFNREWRYMRGVAFSVDGLLGELERGPMRRRHAHALELAVRSQGTCLIQTRAFTKQQYAGLARARATQTHLNASMFSRTLGG